MISQQEMAQIMIFLSLLYIPLGVLLSSIFLYGAIKVYNTFAGLNHNIEVPQALRMIFLTFLCFAVNLGPIFFCNMFFGGILGFHPRAQVAIYLATIPCLVFCTGAVLSNKLDIPLFRANLVSLLYHCFWILGVVCLCMCFYFLVFTSL